MFAGLTHEQVAERQNIYGPNTLPAERFRFLKLCARQFRGTFNILLVVASGIAYALGEHMDAGFILLFVVLSVALSLYQEYKSNAAADRLKTYLLKTITVRRDDADAEVPTADLVPGDMLKLESGDIVPADALVRHMIDLEVNETAFTGESTVVTKTATSETTSGDPANLLLQGVIVVRGTAYAEVIAVGGATRLAKLAQTAASVQGDSELVKGVNHISTFILRATLITLLFVILANVLIDGSNADIPELLVFAIALAVSVIPEALPLVMTFTLSRGALTLAEKNVIVKRLSSVQDLGSVELLCTDKTGTITENHLVYTNDYLIPTSPWHPLVLSRLTSHDLNEHNPEPFDSGTDAALTEDQRRTVSQFTLIEEEAFDPTIRSNGSIVRHANGTTVHIRRGSPRCFLDQGLIAYETVGAWLEQEEHLGHRVLGVSYDDGSGPCFGGFISFTDTIKTTAYDTLTKARHLNVAITIITGDSLRVAEAVGRDVGLVSHHEQVSKATDFFSLSPHEQRKRVMDIRVFARTTPEQKLALIELLKEQCVVGYLGEGINDAPALRAANVSMVVQSASDVARETADIVLVESDLKVIIDGIHLGREAHANTLKYIRATLISNFGNFYAVAVGSLFIQFLPMLPKQLLLLNLLSDFPMMAIAFDRVGSREVTKPQHYNFHALYIIFITLGLVSTVFDFIWFALFFRDAPAVLQTNWFIASVITEILLLLSIRSMLPIGKAGRPATVIIILSVFALVLTVALPVIPATAAFFEFTPPTMPHLVLIVSLSCVYLLVSEAVKRPLVSFLQTRNYLKL